ncbi:MAG: ATP-binding protein [Spirochaetia bacterium]|nr:ATP-binding protein [Spirochaetia bacterium]
MKIKQIKIEKLFGLEKNDFDIECFPNENITILYAFNGTGKTTLLRLIDAVCTNNAVALKVLLFSKIELIFDNGKTVAVEKEKSYGKDYKYLIDGKEADKVEINEIKKEFTVTPVFANKDYNRGVSTPIQNNLKNGKQEANPKGSMFNCDVGAINPIRRIEQLISEKLQNPDERVKVEEFANIINENFPMTFKHLEIQDNKLLAVPDTEYPNDPVLELNMLSSGEIKLILMFYDLLFEAKTDSIVLLDEPESSFHLDWQRNCLSTVMKICEDKDLQVIVATHSPAIVEEYFCLQVPMISARYKK